MKVNANKGLEGTIIFKKYIVGHKLGTGAFGQIYLVTNADNKAEVYAVKAEPVSTKHPQLTFQAKLYKFLSSEGDHLGIPKVYGVGMEAGYNLMMMDLLGKSLEDLFVQHNKQFSIKTVIMIGTQLLDRIKFMHKKGFLHRDLKPDNLLVGVGEHSYLIYLVDMGLAKKYIREGTHIPYKEGKQLTGTARYASISTHQGIEQCRRDDIESMGYVLMYFLRGILPWQNMKAKDTKQKYKLIMEKKITTSLESLCKDYPPEFGSIISYARHLKFQEEPDYDQVKKYLEMAWKRYQFKLDYVFDWTKHHTT